MGFTYISGATPATIVASLTKTQEWEDRKGIRFTAKTLAHKKAGECLYRMVEKTGGAEPPKILIFVDLLEGGGYKTMHEALGPYCVERCPVEWFDKVPLPESHYDEDTGAEINWARDWRERNRTAQAKTASR